MPRIDAPDISDDTVLWRAIYKGWVEKNSDGSETIQSWAFRHPTDEISANIARETTLERFYEKFNPSEYRIAEVTAGAARASANIVCRDPEVGDPSHVLICPPPGKPKNKKIADARKLAAKATLRPEGA